jgi:amino-acid N-acetyltransferase
VSVSARPIAFGQKSKACGNKLVATKYVLSGFVLPSNGKVLPAARFKVMNIEPLDLNNEVKTLLQSESLPTADLHGPDPVLLLGLREGSKIAGVVGVQIFDDAGLLRSLVVSRDCRKTGYGQALVASAEALARERGARSIYLLTATAAGFFAKLGYDIVQRAEAPSAIAKTAQFAGLCPSSATCMYKVLEVEV